MRLGAIGTVRVAESRETGGIIAARGLLRSRQDALTIATSSGDRQAPTSPTQAERHTVADAIRSAMAAAGGRDVAGSLINAGFGQRHDEEKRRVWCD